MVLCGGLELAVGAYIIHEHQKHKKERKRLEGELEDQKHQEKRRRRRHSTSPGQKRPSKSAHKYGYTSGPATGAGKPTATLAGLYAYSAPPPPPAYYSDNQLVVPPQAQQNQPRPISAPPQQQGFPGHYGFQPGYSPPVSHVPPTGAYPGAPQHYSPPLIYPQTAPASQLSGPKRDGQSPPYPIDGGGVYGAGGGWHNRSDSSLPLGIYEPEVDGPYELSADGPWMQDQHRTAHQRPHVRIRLPNDAVVQPGVDSARSPPPSYQAYRPW